MRIASSTKYLGTFGLPLTAARVADRANIWRAMHERGDKSGPPRGPLNFPREDYASDEPLLRVMSCEQLVEACRCGPPNMRRLECVCALGQGGAGLNLTGGGGAGGSIAARPN